MQDRSIGSLIQTPPDLLVNQADRLRASAGLGGGSGSRDVKRVAQEFESLFVTYLLKVMRETIEEAGDSGSASGKGIYTELFDQEFARNISQQRGFGIADLVIKGLKTAQPAAASDTSDVPLQPPVSDGGSVSPEPESNASPRGGEPDLPDFSLPIRAPISSGYGVRNDPFTHSPKFHKGLDIAAPAGMEVRAALGGEVIYSGYEPSYGNTVVVQHTGGLQTRYAHLGRVDVKRGDRIAAEGVLGCVGSTGRSTGPHLHFEVTRWGENITPLAAGALRPATGKGPVPAHRTGADPRG